MGHQSENDDKWIADQFFLWDQHDLKRLIFPNYKFLIGAYCKALKVDEIIKLDNVLSDLTTKCSDVIRLDDFNENLLRQHEDGCCSKCKSRCCSTCRFMITLDIFGLSSVGTSPTNFDQTPSLIYLMIANKPMNFLVFNQISTGLSNHDLIFASYSSKNINAANETKLWRNYKTVHWSDKNLYGKNLMS